MDHSRSYRQTIDLLLFCSFLFCLHDVALADRFCCPPYSRCPNNTSNNSFNSSFQNNLNILLPSLPSKASVFKYYNSTYGNGTDEVYVQYMCLNYVANKECQKCMSDALQTIKNFCPDRTEAVVWEEICQLRYSNIDFVGLLNVADENISQQNPNNISDPVDFQAVVENKLRDLTKLAVFNSAIMYATGEEAFTTDETLYALVQCTLDLSPDHCNKCLEASIKNVSSQCYGSRGARLLSRSCYLRYELYAFYEGDTNSANKQRTTGGGGRKIWIIVVLTIGSAFLVMASMVYCYATRKGTRKGKDEILRDQVQNPNTDFEGLHELKAHDSHIDLATINSATDNFSDSNLLGKGGFGPVYKGVLPDGKEVAVKRLSSFSEQGTLEFTNEVLLILKLQHKNLVRLLGFCVDNQEKLLVYEFMPNSSLDVVLSEYPEIPLNVFFELVSESDPNKRAQLNWSRRFNIINGIARGILYLHEDSRLRIIHRDLKAGNVLLDFDMNPKISDFGMARIFAGSEGEANTAIIVGTYGYMAPEYAMEGLYSIKSDVFSFGVLLLEIITGRRNAGSHHSRDAPTLVAHAWHLWEKGNALELMDPSLTDGCEDEFLRFIQIALLCVQEDAFDRPTMSSVVVMLKGETATLSQPHPPAYSVGRFAELHETFANSVNGLTISSVAPR